MAGIPKWYTAIAIIAILWNLLGWFGVFADLMLRPEDVARLSADQQALYASRTAWSTAASVLAVLAGVAGRWACSSASDGRCRCWRRRCWA